MPCLIWLRQLTYTSYELPIGSLMSFSNGSSVSSNSRSKKVFSSAGGYNSAIVSTWLCVMPKM